MVSCLLKTVVSKTNVSLIIQNIYNQTYQGPPDSFSFHSSSFYQICWQTVGIIIQVPLRSKVDNWIKKVASNWQFYREILVMIYCLKQNFLLILILIWCWIYALQIPKIFQCDIVESIPHLWSTSFLLKHPIFEKSETSLC